MPYYYRRPRSYASKRLKAFYARSASARNTIKGRGAYKVTSRAGRAYIRGQGAYRLPKGSLRKVGGVLGAGGGALIGSMIAPGIGTKAGQLLGKEVL